MEKEKKAKKIKKVLSDEKKVNIKFTLSRLLIAILVVFLIMYFVSIAVNFNPFFAEMVEKNAVVDINEDVRVANELIENKYADLQNVVDDIAEQASRDVSHYGIGQLLNSFRNEEFDALFGDIRFFDDGISYDTSGAEARFEWTELFANSNYKLCSGEYSDLSLEESSCVAFYIPVIGFDNIDGIASILQTRNFIDMSQVLNERAEHVAIVSEAGVNIADCAKPDGFAVGNNYYDFVDDATKNHDKGNEIMAAIRTRSIQTVALKIKGAKYTAVVAPLESTGSEMFLVSLSLNDNLITAEMTYFHHIVVLFVIAIVCLVLLLVYAYLYHKKSKQQLNQANYTYPNLDCPNMEQFKINALNGIRSVSLRKYSIAAFRIRSFKTLLANVGEKSTDELLRFVAKIFESFCEGEEAYAYNGDGIFVFMMKYVDDKSMAKRIKLMKSVCSKSQNVTPGGFNLKYSVGVCHAFGGTKSSVAEMTQNAIFACNMEKDWATTPFVVYDTNINAQLARDEQIEARMEEGLKNGDFKVFFQPKCNIVHDRIDGAEALVRWFDSNTGEYIFPKEFIGLFETNGFIKKLDHYVYLKVLEYFQTEVAKGEKVMPISINVSRVTASSPDFLDFYINNKKKYGVGDGFILLEFTESYATENIDSISNVVKILHDNGIKCSIDDFGTGYSSFGILKTVPFDEIKLDRVFTNKGYDVNRDEMLLKTIVSLFKSLGMHVVLEGVETEEILNKAMAYGCDAIQGFYYAKAIPMEEYKIFLKTPNSIKYKSKVK